MSPLFFLDSQKDLLAKVKKENARTDYENRNCGRYRRIFPPPERHRQERYAKLLYTAFNSLVIGAGANGAIAREIERQYMRKYRVRSRRVNITANHCLRVPSPQPCES